MADGIPTTLNGQGVLALSQLLRGFGTLRTFTPVPQIVTDGIGDTEAAVPREATSAQPIVRQTPPEGIVGATQGQSSTTSTDPNLGRNLDLLA